VQVSDRTYASYGFVCKAYGANKYPSGATREPTHAPTTDPPDPTAHPPARPPARLPANPPPATPLSPPTGPTHPPTHPLHLTLPPTPRRLLHVVLVASWRRTSTGSGTTFRHFIGSGTPSEQIQHQIHQLPSSIIISHSREYPWLFPESPTLPTLPTFGQFFRSFATVGRRLGGFALILGAILTHIGF
jgi:hypothetical protein